MPATIALTHAPTNCSAQAKGLCGRIHVSDVVKVVVYGLGYMQLGTVTAISPIGAISVNFPDGVDNVDEFGFDAIDDLHFLESELEIA